jgi:hypothetical protein
MTENKNVFEHLKSVKIDPKHIEEKNKLKYLSWSFAWQYVKTHYPDTSYKVREWDNKPYLFDEHLGYLVETSVTIQGETISMRLPVMDGANKSQKHEEWTYKVGDYKWENGQKKKVGEIDKVVEQAKMFDINTAIMRCLVKNLAMFGLGLSLYPGEDLPDDNTDKDDKKDDTKPKTTKTDNGKEWLNIGKGLWNDVVNAVKDNIRTIDDIKKTFNMSKETESKLKELTGK